jgi:hypothetical protein
MIVNPAGENRNHKRLGTAAVVRCFQDPERESDWRLSASPCDKEVVHFLDQSKKKGAHGP